MAIEKEAVKVSKSVLLLLMVTPAFFAFTHVLVVTAAPYIQQSLQVSVVATSYLIGLFPFGLSCGMLLFGPFVDRFGSKLTFTLGPLIVLATALASYLAADSISSLTLLHYLQAFGVAAITLSTRVSLHLFANRRSRKLARYYSMEKISCFSFDSLIPYVTALLVALWSWPAIYLIILPIALCFLIFFSYLNAATSLFDQYETKPQKNNLHLVLRNRRFLCFTLLGMSNYAWLYLFYVCLPYLLVNHFALDSFWYALVISSNLMVAVLGSALNICLLRKFKVAPLLLVATTVTCLASVMLLAANFLVPDLFVWLVALFLLMRLTITISTTNSMTLAINSCRRLVSGKATALFCSFCYLTGFLSGVASGYVIALPFNDLTSCLVWLLLINSCALAVSVYSLRLPD